MRESPGRTVSEGPDGVPWPEPGSGFQANQYSPAGELERLGWLAQATRNPGAWRRAVELNWFTKAFLVSLALLGVVILGALVVAAASALLS